jgi:hypothetical protein
VFRSIAIGAYGEGIAAAGCIARVVKPMAARSGVRAATQVWREWMALFYHSQPLLPLGLPALDDEPLHIAHPPPPEVGLQGRAGCLGSRAGQGRLPRQQGRAGQAA